MNRQPDQVPLVPVVRSQTGNTVIALEVDNSLELVAGRELVPAGEGVAPQVPDTPVRCIVLHIEDNRLDRVLVIGPTLNRSVDLLRERLLVGPAAECIEKLLRLKEAGVQQVFLWPVDDEIMQLKQLYEQVIQQIPE